jgi:hypothetical protein
MRNFFGAGHLAAGLVAVMAAVMPGCLDPDTGDDDAGQPSDAPGECCRGDGDAANTDSGGERARGDGSAVPDVSDGSPNNSDASADARIHDAILEGASHGDGQPPGRESGADISVDADDASVGRDAGSTTDAAGSADVANDAIASTDRSSDMSGDGPPDVAGDALPSDTPSIDADANGGEDVISDAQDDGATCRLPRVAPQPFQGVSGIAALTGTGIHHPQGCMQLPPQPVTATLSFTITETNCSIRFVDSYVNEGVVRLSSFDGDTYECFDTSSNYPPGQFFEPTYAACPGLRPWMNGLSFYVRLIVTRSTGVVSLERRCIHSGGCIPPNYATGTSIHQLSGELSCQDGG